MTWYALVIWETDSVIVPVAPPAAGIQEIDWRSWDMVRVPSFFLYAADPLGGAIVFELDSVHCPGRRIGIHPSGGRSPNGESERRKVEGLLNRGPLWGGKGKKREVRRPHGEIEAPQRVQLSLDHDRIDT